MALSGICSTTPSTATSGQKLKVQLVITATPGSSAVSVLRVDPYILNSASQPCFYSGNAVLPIGASSTITASSTAAGFLSYFWDVVLFAPAAPLNPPYPSTPAYDTYTVGAVAYMSDGTTVAASSSVYIYPLLLDSSLALTSMPQPGSLRFDSNVQSGNIAAALAGGLGALVPSTSVIARSPALTSSF